MAEADEQSRPEGGTSGAAGGTGSGGTPSQEELRAQLEEEIRQVRVEDVVLQSAVSILNLAARRIAKEDERDLGQAKVGIEAARALTELATEDARPQLRQAVSELQLLYAKHAGEGEAEGEAPPGEAKATTAGEGSEKEGEKEGDSPLWTPPGS
jgi:hypothetical protein